MQKRKQLGVIFVSKFVTSNRVHEATHPPIFYIHFFLQFFSKYPRYQGGRIGKTDL